MMHDCTYISTPSGRLFTQRWVVEQPVGIVLLVHGLGEHSSRYQWTAGQLNGAGYSVYAYDQRGHGRSDGRRAYIHDMAELVCDLVRVRDSIDTPTSLPYFIYGHSMGALMVGKYVIDHQPTDVAGVLFTGGAFKVDPELSPLLQRLAPLLGRLLPTLKTVKLDPKLVSRVHQEVAEYEEDPLINHQGTYARTGYQMLDTIGYVNRHLDKWHLPILLLHGGSDKLIDPAGSQQFYETIRVKDKELAILPKLYHEVMREPEKVAVLKRMTDWLLARSIA